MTFFDRLDEIRSRHDVLQHSFYQRWSRGELTTDELARYSGQYRHAVVALADAAASAGEAAHAEEEAAHVALWDDFALAVGGDPQAAPERETAACAQAWSGAGEDRDELATLVALYAIESAQPAISETKRDGLVANYGFTAGDAGVRYFELHAELDHDHAAEGRATIEPRLAGADQDALLAEAERVLRANWELLDGVERVTAQPR